MHKLAAIKGPVLVNKDLRDGIFDVLPKEIIPLSKLKRKFDKCLTL